MHFWTKINVLSRKGNVIEKIRVELVQNYSPCCGCAKKIIDFKAKNEDIDLTLTIKLCKLLSS